ncbi:hypothetical protein BV20DRAFT_1051305 [Pilatotrama ljubarskyi]|nr:hypothetical protein BV20DRAFT_1051305 [Pilatotrama ljubarskyi]
MPPFSPPRIPTPQTPEQVLTDSTSGRPTKRRPSAGLPTERTEKTRRTEIEHDPPNLDYSSEHTSPGTVSDMQLPGGSNPSSSETPDSPRRRHSIAIDLDGEGPSLNAKAEHAPVQPSPPPSGATPHSAASMHKGKQPANLQQHAKDTFNARKAHRPRLNTSPSKYSGIFSASDIRSDSGQSVPPSAMPF